MIATKQYGKWCNKNKHVNKISKWILIFEYKYYKIKYMVYSHKSVELEYYVREGISPVHQDISDLNKNFQTRESLLLHKDSFQFYLICV